MDHCIFAHFELAPKPPSRLEAYRHHYREPSPAEHRSPEAAATAVMTPHELSERTRGWLRYLYRKAHTPDDWSREGQPHPHWGDKPMRRWPRFDLVDSNYAVALMARTTPAWREPYVAVLD
jgi:hypothetical protein